MMNVRYMRQTPDEDFAAWYAESDYRGHHYRVYASSPWHLPEEGGVMRFETEAAARAAVDTYMDVLVPMVLQAEGKQLCPLCSRMCLITSCHTCVGCKRQGCLSCVDNSYLNDPECYVCWQCLQVWDEWERRYGGL